MRPTVGRIVHYFTLKNGNEPSAALVNRAISESRLNLIVFPFDAKPEIGVRGLPSAAELIENVDFFAPPKEDAKEPEGGRPAAWWAWPAKV